MNYFFFKKNLLSNTNEDLILGGEIFLHGVKMTIEKQCLWNVKLVKS